MEAQVTLTKGICQYKDLQDPLIYIEFPMFLTVSQNELIINNSVVLQSPFVQLLVMVLGRSKLKNIVKKNASRKIT